MIATRPLPANEHYPVPGWEGIWRPPVSRHAGQDHTLNPWPGGVGANGGYMGRDVLSGEQPYHAEPGMFRRLHTGR